MGRIGSYETFSGTDPHLLRNQLRHGLHALEPAAWGLTMTYAAMSLFRLIDSGTPPTT